MCQKKSGEEGILALNTPTWAEIETSKFTFHPPNRLFCLHVSRRLKVTPQTLQLVNFYDRGICSQQKIANRKSVRCFGNRCFGVSRNVWIFWMFFLFLPNQSKAGKSEDQRFLCEHLPMDFQFIEAKHHPPVMTKPTSRQPT